MLFFSNGNNAIVVLDVDEPETAALQLATMWARWMARERALRTIDARARDLSPEAADRLDLHIRKDRQGLGARYTEAAGKPEYESAFYGLPDAE